MARQKNSSRGTNLLSIGEAVGRLKKDFPTLSISKVRYLEDEGLIKPTRTKGGYRLFSDDDISRLNEVLRLQSEQFLPLTVIKERMEHWLPGDGQRVESEDRTGLEAVLESSEPISLDELFKLAGIGTETVRALESFGLVKTVSFEKGLGVDQDDADILVAFSRLFKFGIEPRHLRLYENLAQRESVLFQQIIRPQIKHKSRELRQKSLDDLEELIGLTEKIRRLMLKKSLREANLLQ